MQGLFKLVAASIPQRQQQHPLSVDQTTNTYTTAVVAGRPGSSWRVPFSRVRRQERRRRRQQHGNSNDLRDDDDDGASFIHGPTIVLTNRENTSQGQQQQEQQQQRQQPTATASSLGLLYNLSKTWKFEAVEERCLTHPHEVSATRMDRNGDTMLHWVVFGNPPVSTVETLVRTCPELTTIPNKDGNLPLHVACSYRAHPNVIQCLVQSYPESVTIPNHKEFTALHIICDAYCRPPTFDIILDELAKRNELRHVLTKKDLVFNRTPLGILNTRKNLAKFIAMADGLELLIRRKQNWNSEDGIKGWTQHDEAMLNRAVKSAQFDPFWWKARRLILAEYYDDFSQQQKGRYKTFSQYANQFIDTINACISLDDCPPSLFSHALLAHHDELTLAYDNEHNNLPLHNVCMQQHDRPQREVNAKVLEVLRAYPHAAKIENSNRSFPLEIFLDRNNNNMNSQSMKTTKENMVDDEIKSKKPIVGWSRTLFELLLGNILALQRLHVDVRLYPYILSKMDKSSVTIMNGQRREDSYLRRQYRTAVFELLRESSYLMGSSAT